MNEPLLNKANEILENHGKRTIFGGIRFNSHDKAIHALIEFGKYYEHYEHETPEEKIKEGDDVNVPICRVCKREYLTGCLCHI